MKKITEADGEGLMLKDPESIYDFKRSKHLLKVKVFHDEEATITGYMKGKGKYMGMLGAYVCEKKDSKFGTVRFQVGSGLVDK